MPVTYKGYDTTLSYTNKEIVGNREAWVAALRSGEYKQGEGYLNDEGRFCCLGVACEVLGVRGITLGLDTATAYNSNVGYPDYSVVKALGLKTPEGELKSGGKALSVLNDFSGYDFNMIADEIDKDTRKTYGDANAYRL